MRIRIAEVALVFALLFSSAAGLLFVNPTSANPNYIHGLPAIIVQSDGTITPDTGQITKNGTTYTMNTDITNQYVIRINCSNIIFDGKGHVLNGSYPYPPYPSKEALGTTDDNGITMTRVTNVTVKDIEIVGITYTNYQSIYLAYCTSCTLLRVKADNALFQGGSLNAIVESTFKHSITGDYIVPTPSPTPTLPPSPSQTTSVPEFSCSTILPILLVIPIVLFIIRKTVSRNISL
jgi:hypothetical protein